jgi:glycosyltransferase involved in cell wall biosynthesis
MKTPAVSVLIPTYNYARYLPEAIDSVLAQDFGDFEIIIADDASTDNTPEVCRMYEAKDPRIRFFRHKKNLGMVENWNWCLQQARGKYIKYLLADDKFAKPYALKRLVGALEQPGVSLSVSARILIDESSQITGIWNPLGRKNRAINGTRVSVRCLNRNTNLIGEPTAVLFRKTDAGRGFDPAFRQLVDLEMWLNLLQCGDLAYLHEPLCCFRQHAGQQTEVNRASGLHLQELIRLGDYMPKYKERLMKFRWLYHLKKDRSPACAELIESLRKDFSLPVYLYSMLEYKLRRPFENLQHGLRKRIRFDQ